MHRCQRKKSLSIATTSIFVGPPLQPVAPPHVAGVVLLRLALTTISCPEGRPRALVPFSNTTFIYECCLSFSALAFLHWGRMTSQALGGKNREAGGFDLCYRPSRYLRSTVSSGFGGRCNLSDFYDRYVGFILIGKARAPWGPVAFSVIFQPENFIFCKLIPERNDLTLVFGFFVKPKAAEHDLNLPFKNVGFPVPARLVLIPIASVTQGITRWPRWSPGHHPRAIAFSHRWAGVDPQVVLFGSIVTILDRR